MKIWEGDKDVLMYNIPWKKVEDWLLPLGHVHEEDIDFFVEQKIVNLVFALGRLGFEIPTEDIRRIWRIKNNKFYDQKWEIFWSSEWLGCESQQLLQLKELLVEPDLIHYR